MQWNRTSLRIFILGVFVCAILIVLYRRNVSDDHDRLAGETKRVFNTLKIGCSAMHELSSNSRDDILREIKEWLEISGEYDRKDAALRNALSGIDLWGNPIRVERNEDRAIVARSSGPDGVFGEGESDDIEQIIWCPLVLEAGAKK